MWLKVLFWLVLIGLILKMGVIYLDQRNRQIAWSQYRMCPIALAQPCETLGLKRGAYLMGVEEGQLCLSKGEEVPEIEFPLDCVVGFVQVKELELNPKLIQIHHQLGDTSALSQNQRVRKTDWLMILKYEQQTILLVLNHYSKEGLIRLIPTKQLQTTPSR